LFRWIGAFDCLFLGVESVGSVLALASVHVREFDPESEMQIFIFGFGCR